MLSADTITTSTAPKKRRRLSIVQALRWAIRNELPKRRQDIVDAFTRVDERSRLHRR